MILTSFNSFLCQDGHFGVGDVYCERHIMQLVDSRWIQEGEALRLPPHPEFIFWQTVVYVTSLDQKSLTWKWLISHIYVSCTSKLKADINHIFLSETITATPAFGLWFWHQSDAWCQKVFGMAIAFWHSLPQYYKNTSSMNIFPISAVQLEQRVTLWARNP